LKGGRRIGKAEKYNSGFEEPITSFEGHFPFIAFLNADIVIPPSDIELGEPFFSRDTMDELRYKWKRVVIWHGPFV